MRRLVAEIIPLGTMTQYGEIVMVGCLQGERYYWMIDHFGVVSMIPDCALDQPPKAPESE